MDYRLMFSGGLINVSASGHQEVQHTISELDSGTKYSFTVFAVFENIQSNGTQHTAATGDFFLGSPYMKQSGNETLSNYLQSYFPFFSLVPPKVTEVSVTERTVTKITLSWNVDVGKTWHYILHFNGTNVTFPPDNDVLSHTLSPLSPGTEYTFSLVTRFFDLNSKAYEGFTVTSKEKVASLNLLWLQNQSWKQTTQTCLFSVLSHRLFWSELAHYRLFNSRRGWRLVYKRNSY